MKNTGGNFGNFVLSMLLLLANITVEKTCNLSYRNKYIYFIDVFD